MKKYCLFSLILFFPIIASAVQYACPDQAQLISNSGEISEGSVKSISSLSIGICGASENSILGWIESTIFLDANLISLDNQDQTKGTELVSGNSSINYSTISGGTQVTLKIGSAAEDLEIGDCAEIGGLEVMVKSIQTSGSLVEVLVATKKIILNTKQKPSEIIDVNSKKYAVQLLAGSSVESTVKISRCSSGDIYEIAEPIQTPVQNTTNSTINNTLNNQTIINNTQINQTSQNNTLNNTALKEINQTCSNNEECTTNYCKDGLCTKKGFFRRIFDWFKNLF